MAFIGDIQTLIKKLKQHSIEAYSAHASFFILLSSVPFAMFLLTIMNRLHISSAVISGITPHFVPAKISEFLLPMFAELEAKSTNTALSITAVTTLWSASKGIHSITRGLNKVFDISETRNFIWLRFLSTIYTLAMIFVILATLAVTVFGNIIYRQILENFKHLDMYAAPVMAIRTIAGLFFLTVFFILLYAIVPNRKTKILKQLPGAVISSCGWIGFSYLFSFYVDNISSFSYIYGGLTAFIIMMLWLYSCMYILFFGAEINALAEEGHFSKETLINSKY